MTDPLAPFVEAAARAWCDHVAWPLPPADFQVSGMRAALTAALAVEGDVRLVVGAPIVPVYRFGAAEVAHDLAATGVTVYRDVLAEDGTP